MYFEIDDVKRRHSAYFDVYNVHGWIDTPFETFGWDWARGAAAGVTGYAINEVIAHKWEGFKLLRSKFHPPDTFAQLLAYNKAINNIEGAKQVMKGRMSYAIMAGSIDIGGRLAVYRYFSSGLYQSYGSVNVEAWRRFLPLAVSSLATSWIMAPLEVARAAFIGDKTFPQELRKGYRSPHHALFRLMKEQPYALFKNSLPTFATSYVQTSFLLGIYDYLYDLASPIFREADAAKDAVKLP